VKRILTFLLLRLFICVGFFGPQLGASSWHLYAEKKLIHMQINQPEGDKLKMREHKLQSGVNLHGVLKQKYVKQGLSVHYCTGTTISTI
jgi:hypothetical protein